MPLLFHPVLQLGLKVVLERERRWVEREGTTANARRVAESQRDQVLDGTDLVHVWRCGDILFAYKVKFHSAHSLLDVLQNGAKN